MSTIANLENIKDVSHSTTNAGVGFLAGLAAGHTIDEKDGHPFLVNGLTGEITSLERFLKLPLRQTTKRTIFTVDAFCEYVKRFKKPDSSIYVQNGPNFSFVVLAEIDHISPTAVAWIDHSASVHFTPSESLAKWTASNKKRLSQEEFADLLEERARDIVSPAAADILELAQSLHVTRNLSVSSVVRASQGSNSLKFNQDQKLKAGADGDIDLPTQFKISIEPFARHREKATITAFLRPRVVDDRPTFSYELQLLDEAVEEVLDTLLAAIRTQTALPVYR